MYLSVSKKFPFVDLRKFFYPKDQITPYATRRGIALRAKEWSKLSKLIPHIDRILKIDSFIKEPNIIRGGTLVKKRDVAIAAPPCGCNAAGPHGELRAENSFSDITRLKIRSWYQISAN